MRSLRIPATSLMVMAMAGCHVTPGAPADSASSVRSVAQSAVPGDQLAQVKALLPKVAAPGLQAILDSSQTFWYDHDSMTPSYQAAISESPPMGANANNKWLNLVAGAVLDTAANFYDKNASNWRFPFATTAGADDSTNLKTFDFVSLPAKNGALLPILVTEKPRAMAPVGLSLDSWGWVYPIGAVVGECLFIKTPTGDLLPVEIRTRTRYASGWAVNAFRPFRTADALSQAVQQHRPNWQTTPALAALVSQLANPATLTDKHLAAPQLPGVFDQTGSLDVLPDFGDQALVKELLTQTMFVSTYKAAWKSGGGKTAYAASTQSNLSIVPINYAAGVIEVSEDSCMRCHKETGRGLTNFRSDFSEADSGIDLYGEMWGRDGIFTFHPFDESQYAIFWNASEGSDNRKLNPVLAGQGMIAAADAAPTGSPDYPASEIVGGSSGGPDGAPQAPGG